MPFSWSNLKPSAAKGLATALGLDPRHAVTELEALSGAPPTQDFVGENWPALRDEWLERDRQSAKAVASALAEWGVGRDEMPRRNHEQRMAYLRTCRTSKAVREVVAAELSAAGSPEPADTAPPAASAEREVPSTQSQRAATELGNGPAASSGEEITGDSSAAAGELAASLATVNPANVPALLAGLVLSLGQAVPEREGPSDELLRRALNAAVYAMTNFRSLAVGRLDPESAGSAMDAATSEAAAMVADGIADRRGDLRLLLGLVIDALDEIILDAESPPIAETGALNVLVRLAGPGVSVDGMTSLFGLALDGLRAAADEMPVAPSVADRSPGDGALSSVEHHVAMAMSGHQDEGWVFRRGWRAWVVGLRSWGHVRDR